MASEKYRVSRDTPAPYITMVAKDRLPVFQTDVIKTITCNAIDEARQSHSFLLFAYVIMPDHMHLLTDQPDKPSNLLRYVKGTIAHRVIEYLKEKNYQSSLEKLQHEEWKRNHRYFLWQQEKNVFSVFSEAVFTQKVNYIHQNPVPPDWSNARLIIAGPALVSGKDAIPMVSRCELTLIESNGEEGRSLKERESRFWKVTRTFCTAGGAATRGIAPEIWTNASGRSQTFRTSGGTAAIESKLLWMVKTY